MYLIAPIEFLSLPPCPPSPSSPGRYFVSLLFSVSFPARPMKTTLPRILRLNWLPAWFSQWKTLGGYWRWEEERIYNILFPLSLFKGASPSLPENESSICSPLWKQYTSRTLHPQREDPCEFSSYWVVPIIGFLWRSLTPPPFVSLILKMIVASIANLLITHQPFCKSSFTPRFPYLILYLKFLFIAFCRRIFPTYFYWFPHLLLLVIQSLDLFVNFLTHQLDFEHHESQDFAFKIFTSCFPGAQSTE